jgi:hypothetical protein
MQMNKGLIRTLLAVTTLMLPLAALPEGEIYKVVDKDGNVIYTDQRPSPAAEPMDLPPLSVVQTEAPPPAPEAAAAVEEQAAEPTTRELRKLYADFRITQPQPEETFWGTENTVAVAWGSSQPIPPEMAVKLYVDGVAQDVAGNGSVSLTLDRGEHTVYAELLDARKRRIVTTETITFFVKQHSVNFNRPAVTPRNTGR